MINFLHLPALFADICIVLTKERKKNERRKYFAVHFIAFLFSSQFLFLSCCFFLLFSFLSFVSFVSFFLFFLYLTFSSSCYFCLFLFFLSLSSFRFVFLCVPILIPHFSFLLFCSSFFIPPFPFLLFHFSFSVPLFLFLFFPFLLLSFFRRVRSIAKAPCRQRQASSQILCPLSQSTISVQSLTRHASLCLLHCRLLCKL